MNIEKKIVFISGSLRKNSFNTKILKNFENEISKYGFDCTFIDLNKYPLPFFNEDLETENLPENLLVLKKIFQNSCGLVVASPEYNGEISAVLKNTFDWLSRKLPGEVPKQSFLNLSSIAITASTGKNGASRALERLKILLSRLGVDDEILTYNLGKASMDLFDQQDNILINNEINKIKSLSNYFANLIHQEEDLYQHLKVS